LNDTIKSVDYRARNECRIVAMRCVPIASVEDAYGVCVFCRQVAEELDEPNFIVDLSI